MSSWINGNLQGSLSVGQGERGKSLEYEWRGTWLGIRREGEEEYQFVNLASGGAGSSGADGREIELQVGNGYIQWRYKGEEEWNNLISIDSLKGEPGEQGLPGRDGVDGKDGTNGINGQDGANGKDGVTPNITIGTVTTLEAGEKATVTREGTKENPVFNFGIPRGADGSGGNSGDSASIDDSTISTNKTWSSSKIEDFVLTNNNTIWKDVNGENLSIQHTKEGFLREVEVWGNTIQNQDDLSDIKHLGELYVNDDGQPILDSEGRKQYKIEVESMGDFPLSYFQAPRNATVNGQHVKLVCDSKTKYWADVLYGLNPNDVEIGDIVTLEITILNKTNLKDNNPFYLNNQYNFGNNVSINTTILNKKQVYTTEITKLPNVKSRFLMFGIDKSQLIDESLEGSIEFHYKIYSNKTKSNKTTILIPCQLSKVGDISDRLYWDKNKGRYVVEKNIDKAKIEVDFSKITSDNRQIFLNVQKSLSENFDCGWIRTKALTSHLKYGGWGAIPTDTKYSVGIYSDGDTRIYTKTGEVVNTDEMKGMLEDGKYFYCYGKLKTSQLIETNITEELKLPTYINNTYISVIGGIDGGIKAKAPIDGEKVIKTLQRENAEIKATNDKQDELINTTMLATDEMFMMLEPLLSEMLVNKKSSSKIINMYVAMVQRGIKELDEVPVRYREEVKKILMELE